jgi:ribonuclease BN (tRNA processing enzyme)
MSLLDCGASSLIAMKRARVDPSEIGWIVVSHLHGDHFGGIPFLVLDGQFSRRTRPLLVAGPPTSQQRVEAAMEVFFPGSAAVVRQFTLEFIELGPRTASRVGPMTVTAFPAVHESGAPSYSVRVECAGKVIVYSGDTEWTEDLVEAAHGADLVICEAYFFQKKVKYHLDYATLLRQRERLDCRRLIVTHMHRDMLDRLADVEIESATDGQTILL